MVGNGFESLDASGGEPAAAKLSRGVVEVDGRRLSYLSAGGPTMLLIHGSGVSARCWTNQFRGLGGTLPVLAIDLPGHGESDPSEAALPRPDGARRMRARSAFPGSSGTS